MSNKYCIDCKKHVDGPHDSGHKVVAFGLTWPPKKRASDHFPKFTSKVVSLPSVVDLRPVMKAGGFQVFDQGQQGSCTANAGCGDLALMHIKRGDYQEAYARAFLYADERIEMGTFPQDSGANMIDICKVRANQGVCLEHLMPYNQFDTGTRPSAAATSDALNRRCDSNVLNVPPSHIQEAIYACSLDVDLGGVMIGFPVPTSFMQAINNGGWVPIPSITESILGGHAMLVLGYKTMTGPDGVSRLYFIVQNSWGFVGDSSVIPGIFYFPMEFFTSTWVAANFGTDNVQQRNLPSATPPTPPPSGSLVLTLNSATLPNDGSLAVTGTLSGLVVGDSFELDVLDSQGNIIANMGTASAPVPSISLVLSYTGPYVGLASVKAFDHTSNLSSNTVSITITVGPPPTPNPCKVGNAGSRLLNAVPYVPKWRFPFLRARKGRFYYLNP